VYKYFGLLIQYIVSFMLFVGSSFSNTFTNQVCFQAGYILTFIKKFNLILSLTYVRFISTEYYVSCLFLFFFYNIVHLIIYIL
jgi:hypothetical protein